MRSKRMWEYMNRGYKNIKTIELSRSHLLTFKLKNLSKIAKNKL